MKRFLKFSLLVLALLVVFSAGWVTAKLGIGEGVDPASLTELERRFTEQMTGAALVGSFTLTGREDRPPRADRYDIASVEKIGDDRWRFNARIGETGVSLPMV